MELGSFKDRLNSVIPDRGKAAFARTAGIGQATLHQYLSGESEPGMKALIAIANAADVSLLWLATGEGPMRSGDKVVSYSTGVIQADNINGSQVVAEVGSSSDGRKRRLELDAEIAELVELLQAYGNSAMVAEIKSKLLKIKEIMEG